MEDLETYYIMVEDVILSFGVDPVACRGDKPGMWKMFKGSAEVWIDIWHFDREQRAYFQVMAPVMELPKQQREEFYRDLLELNDQMFGVAFSVSGNWAYIRVLREVEGLGHNEVEATINRVGIYCDDYDDMLRKKYGVTIEPGAPPGL
jgi:hypothetical protein